MDIAKDVVVGTELVQEELGQLFVGWHVACFNCCVLKNLDLIPKARNEVDNSFLAVHLQLAELLQCSSAIGRSGRRMCCLELPEQINAIASLD